MGYYDSVKENVKKQATDSTSGSSESSGGNFDTLKKAASETEPDEEKGDDTPIEVLEEDGLSRNPKRRQNSSDSEGKRNDSKKSSDSSSGNPFKDKNTGTGEKTAETDLSSVEDKLDTIIEQNQELINVLKSFAE